MQPWNAPPRPADYAEEMLVTAIVEGDYPPGSTLPGERDLAAQLGVTRPTLREALQRLARDGWLTIHQGKATVVNDFWREGGLNVLSTLVRHNLPLPPDFIPDLLRVRLAMAPDYTRMAVENDPETIGERLHQHTMLPDTAEAFTAFDWTLQHELTLASGNPIYPLILNGFAALYQKMGLRYFSAKTARAASRDYYAALLTAFEARDAATAAHLTQEIMEHSIHLWQHATDAPHA